MSVKLAALYPTHLDLNGDQANLKVAQKRMSWFGYDVEIVSVGKGEAIPSDVVLIFLGHGSMAAWSDIEQDLNRLAPEIKNRIENGTAFMAVATGHERAIQLGLIQGEIFEQPRVSKFEIAEIDGLEVLGYLNSATNAPVIQKIDLVLGTQLHGPIFAKNPSLVDSYMAEVFAANVVPVPSESESNRDSSLKNNADLVAGIVDQVWDLERGLASE